MHRTEGTNHSSNLFVDGPPGTYVEYNWCNAVQEEICYFIEQNGLTLKTAATETRQQLYEAAIEMLGSDSYLYTDAGTANAKVLTKITAATPSALFNGMTVMFYAAATNTGATTVTVDSFASKSIVDSLGNGLIGGEIVAGELVLLIYNLSGDYFKLIFGAKPLTLGIASGGYVSGGKNLIVNGSTNITQHYSYITGVSSGEILMDNWLYEKSGTMVHNYSQASGTALDSYSEDAFGYDQYITLTTADGSMATSDFCTISTFVEGSKLKTAQASGYVTLSFWIQTANAGTYYVSLTNSGADRSYVIPFTQTTTHYEFHQATIPLNYSGGTWDYYEGVGLKIRFCLASGTDYQTGTSLSWVTGDYLCKSDQENGCNIALSSVVMVKNVQLEVGRYFTGYDQKSIRDELLDCYRYRFGIPGGGRPWIAGYSTGTYFYASFTVPGGMRSSSPTVYDRFGFYSAYAYVGGNYYGLSVVSVFKTDTSYGYLGNPGNYTIQYVGNSALPSIYNTGVIVLNGNGWFIDDSFS